jgi:NADPH:quinone reductase-like Zn-dependent oxidoreductase
MKAAVVTRYGPPEVLEVRDVPAPEPGDDDVLVRVHALGGLRRPKASILGADLSGTVVSVGKNVTRFAPGDEVFGSRGEKFGGYAEFACVAQDGFLAKKPATMTLEEAATVFVGGVCSLYFLRKASIQPGEKVLVHGASGSLGTFAVQLAKYYGAHVTGVCGPANVDLVRSLGADAVIDYTTQDFTDGGPIYDVICDVMGKSGFPASLRALKSRGRYLLVGFAGGILAILAAMLHGIWAHLRGRAVFMAGPARPVQADLEFLKTLIEDGRLRAVIGRAYPLNDIVEAHRYADGGHKVGNVVVVIP